MKKLIMALAVATLTLFTACTTDNDDNSSVSTNPADIVGNWYSDVSGMTYSKWSFGKTWQNTVFNADGTGSTRIYYMKEDEFFSYEKIDFTYTASSNGELVMTPTDDRDVMKAGWKIVGKQLRINDGDRINLKLKPTTDAMAANFETWNNDKEALEVPKPAKYTVFVYGNAPGSLSDVIETGFWEPIKQYLTDHDNVRIINLYKYGTDEVDDNGNHSFTGKYANPGDLVCFELTSKTNLKKINEVSFNILGMGSKATQIPMCNSYIMRAFLELSSLECPAENYVLALWGTGSGYIPNSDVPGLTHTPANTTRGMMADPWINYEELNMYDIQDALKGFGKVNTIFFHTAYMGNIETFTQLRDRADYILGAAHELSSDGNLLTEFVRGLVETDDTEKACKLMFERATPEWQKQYIYEPESYYDNGDLKMVRTDKLEPIIDASKQLCNRLLELYPTQKEAIDQATSKAYRYSPIYYDEEMDYEWHQPFFDIANYAQLLANETGDAEFKKISAAMDKAMNDAIICYQDISNSKQHLDHYTLSVCLLRQLFYTYDVMAKFPDWGYLYNFKEGYEMCDFHKLTGWGNWNNTNQQALGYNPHPGGGGKLE